MKHPLLLMTALILGGITSCTAHKDRNMQPNILFCIADDQSFPHAGAYGCSWVSTPSFDRIAREGILFHNAYTPNAKCAPSRSCILTGRNSWQLEAAANHVCIFPPRYKSFVESLADHGYFVGHTAKGWGPGTAHTTEGSPREMVGPAFSQRQTEPPAAFISKVDYAANFEAFLTERPEDQPFFFWYGSLEPHRAYEFGAGVSKAGKSLEDLPEVPPYWPDCDTVRNDMLDYAFEVEYFDQHVGKMLDLLESGDLLENTLVIVTSDHGMPFPRIKGMPNVIANHVPLAMMWKKGIEHPGRETDDMFSFTDFAPTLLELAGISFEQSGMQAFEGQSIVPLMRDEETTAGRSFIVIGKERTDIGRPDDQGYPSRGIYDGRYIYLRNFKPERWPAGNPETGYLDTDGSPTKTKILNHRRKHGKSIYWDLNFGKKPAEELYDHSEDPHLMINLAADPEHQATRSRLKDLLFSELKSEGDPRMFGQGDIFDKYPYARENHRDFYNKFVSGDYDFPGWVNETDFEQTRLE